MRGWYLVVWQQRLAALFLEQNNALTMVAVGVDLFALACY
jgi:hypothetical protein